MEQSPTEQTDIPEEPEDREEPAGSILESIQVLARASAELKHHAARLEGTAGATAHMLDMARLYRDSARGCRVLKRFQQGRMRRTATEQAHAREGITPAGHSEAHV